MNVVRTWRLCQFSVTCTRAVVVGILPRVNIVPGIGFVQLHPVPDPSGSISIIVVL